MLNFIRKNNLIIWIFIAIVIMVIGLILNMLYTQRQMLVDAHKGSLQVLASEKSAQVNMFFDLQKEKLQSMSSMDVFKQAVLYPGDALKVTAAKNTIVELGGTMALFTSKGIIVYAGNAPAGTDYSADPYFISEDKQIIFSRYYDIYEKKDFYSVLGPIYDSQDKNKVIGAIGFHINLDDIGALMKQVLENQTSEVYLIDGEGMLLSGSKYIGQGNKQGILIQDVRSEGATACLDHIKKYGDNESINTRTEDVLQYKNYMGNEVFGAHAYVPAIGGCVIAEEGSNHILGFPMIDYVKNIFSKK